MLVCCFWRSGLLWVAWLAGSGLSKKELHIPSLQQPLLRQADIQGDQWEVKGHSTEGGRRIKPGSGVGTWRVMVVAFTPATGVVHAGALGRAKLLQTLPMRPVRLSPLPR